MLAQLNLNDLLSGGSTTWIIVGVVAFLLLRGGAGGGLADTLLELLRTLFNRPRPVEVRPPAVNKAKEQCGILCQIAARLAEQGKTDLSKKLIDLAGEVHRAGGHDDDDHATPTAGG